MNNKTKRSLTTSITALALCFAMLLGTTFAWFTDTASSEGNVIQTGSLKLDFELLDEEGNWNSIRDSKAPLFNYDKWEPGYVDVKVLKVKNEGSLAFKWKAVFVSDEEELSDLAEVIDVYVRPWGVGDDNGVTYPTDRNLEDYTKVGTLDRFIRNIESTTYGNLKAGESAYLGIALKMQEDAGNEYQDLSLGKFDIKIVATQDVGEFDSYDDQYDAGAEWPTIETGYSASTAINSDNLTLGALNSEITIGAGGVGATIPADVKVADGATELTLTLKSVETDGNLTLGEGDSATSFDVHIEGIADDNEQPMRVDLGAILPTGLTDTELKLYHTENGTAVQMTRVASVNDFAIHNQYTYNAETGEVSIYVKSFSAFTLVSTTVSAWTGSTATAFASGSGTEANPYLIKTGAQLAYFRNQVDEGNTFDGKYVALGADINLNGINFDPIGYGYYSDTNTSVFMGTFDGKGYTIYNLYQNGWDLDSSKYTYSTAGAGLFASIKDATIKNLIINGASIIFECVDMGTVVGYAQGNCHFENIVVTNTKLANYNRYTGGIVGEVCKGSYGTDVTKGYSHTFKNVTVDSTVKISSLWGSFDTSCGGVIGGKWGDATVKMENVTVACELDVFSDVTAAYQWYAYRRCGMLIGHTEQNSPKHATKAAADFLTCSGVVVYYGGWANYTYCEFTNQDNSWCNNYPWVRVQAGEHNDAYGNARYGVPVIDGNKITATHTHADGDQCSISIPFNQLYGGGQGVYGQGTHTGVTTTTAQYITQTVYFENNKDWDEVYIYYWCQNGDDQWDNTAFPGQEMNLVSTEGAYEVYSFKVPTYAQGFVFSDGKENITGTEHFQTVDILLSDDPDGKIFYLGEIDYDQVVEGNKVDYKYTAYSTDYVDGYKTVYFKNEWQWSDVKVHYWTNSNGHTQYPGVAMDWVANDGIYDYFKTVIPMYAESFMITDGSTLDENGVAPVDKKTPTINISDVDNNEMFYMFYDSSATNNYQVKSEDYDDHRAKYKVIYLDPGVWNQANAWFQAWTWGGDQADSWVTFGDINNDGIYEAYVFADRTGMKLYRKGPTHTSNNHDDNQRWNVIDGITITDNYNLYTISDWGSGSWSVKE